MDIFFRILLNYTIIVITQFTIGKKGAFLYALLFDLNIYIVSIVIIACDMVLMFLIGSLFQITLKRFLPVKLFQWQTTIKENKLKKSRWTQKITRFGKISPLVLTAIPFAGGVWSGMALSKILHLNNKDTYWLVSIGSIIGCAIFLLAALGLIKLF